MRSIKPLATKSKIYENEFFVFDVETWGLDARSKKLAFGVVYGNNFIKVLHTPEQFQNEFKKEIYRGKNIFAHNAEFDLSVIFGNVIQNVDSSAIFNGKFIATKYFKTNFVDSANLYPSTLEKIGEAMGFEKGVTPEKFINADSSKKITDQDIDYCIKDCKITFEALKKIFYKIDGIRITIASAAMFHFRKSFLSAPIVYNDLNELFFESYYGGRTEAFKIGNVKAKVYDINSLYPSIMKNISFPDIKNLKRFENISIDYFGYLLNSKEGFAKVTVRHRKSYFGTLPKKLMVGKSVKLVFPVGTFETTVNFNELRFSVNNGYSEILKVDYCICANKIETLFAEYVDELYNERKNETNELNRTILKLLLNSLYGRFGMREKYKTEYFKNIPVGQIEFLKRKNHFYELKTFGKLRNDCYLITENLQMKKSFFAIPSLASYITSGARLELLKGMIKNENKKIVYCDTDSIFLEEFENIDLPITNELGDWKLENKEVTEIRGLKNYSYIENGIEKDAIKGVSKRAKKIGKNKFEIIKLTKTKEAIRRNIETGKPTIQIKELKHKYDKRILFENGETEPIELNLNK